MGDEQVSHDVIDEEYYMFCNKGIANSTLWHCVYLLLCPVLFVTIFNVIFQQLPVGSDNDLLDDDEEASICAAKPIEIDPFDAV